MPDYTFIQEIGRGGMGCVYYGTTPSGQPTAIKKLDSKFVSIPDFREFFDTEARALSEMNHPSVVKIVGETFSDNDGNLYLPMEYIEGETLQQYINEHGPYSENEACALMIKILEAFSYIHKQGKVHRDIKPSNIMLRSNNCDICVIDFGIAKDMKTPTGKTIGRCVGTDGYMSPEQIKGLTIDSRTDIYSLGCLLFFLLTGKNAIEKQINDYETSVAILNHDYPSVRSIHPELSEQIEKIIFKAVDKNMLNRFQSASAFSVALTNISSSFISEPTKVALATVTVGRSDSCDYTFPSIYVSSKHLKIEYVDDVDGSRFVLYDNSTNGTGVNGRFIHNNSFSIPFDINNNNAETTLPIVLLAGRDECKLQWPKVLSKIKDKMNMNPTTDKPKEERKVNDTTRENDNLGIGLSILSFFFPIVGWVIFALWKNTKSKAAHKALVLAWIGFSINFIINLMIIL